MNHLIHATSPQFRIVKHQIALFKDGYEHTFNQFGKMLQPRTQFRHSIAAQEGELPSPVLVTSM